MRSYETMFIVNPLLSEEETLKTLERVKTVITSAGKITAEDDWGVKDLAYEMQKQKSGHFYVVNFEAPKETLDELNHVFRITENIFRGIIVKTN